MSQSKSKSNEDDVASTEVAFRISQALGVRTDAAVRIVDTYGVDYCLPALADIQRQIASGKRLTNPFGALVGLLKSGRVQAQTLAGAERRTIGTEWLLFRCPRCRAFLSVTFPVIQGGAESWDQKPMLRCDSCREMSPTVGWKVAITLYEPFEKSEAARRVETRRTRSRTEGCVTMLDGRHVAHPGLACPCGQELGCR